MWKDIKGYEGQYMVSYSGEVKSLDRIIIKTNGIAQRTKGKMLSIISNQGYSLVSLSKGHYINVFVHRLVAEAFIPNPENKTDVNHINGNKADNKVENLEWLTRSENQIHSYRILKRKVSKAFLGRFGKDHPRSRKVKCINNGVTYSALNDAARELNISYSKISLVCSGQRKHTKGYKFEYQP